MHELSVPLISSTGRAGGVQHGDCASGSPVVHGSASHVSYMSARGIVHAAFQLDEATKLDAGDKLTTQFMHSFFSSCVVTIDKGAKYKDLGGKCNNKARRTLNSGTNNYPTSPNRKGEVDLEPLKTKQALKWHKITITKVFPSNCAII